MKKKYSNFFPATYHWPLEELFGELAESIVYDAVDMSTTKNLFEEAFKNGVDDPLGKEVSDYLRDISLNRKGEWRIVVHDALNARQIDPRMTERWGKYGFGYLLANATVSPFRMKRIFSDSDFLVCIKERLLLKGDVELWLLPLKGN